MIRVHHTGPGGVGSEWFSADDHDDPMKAAEDWAAAQIKAGRIRQAVVYDAGEADE